MSLRFVRQLRNNTAQPLVLFFKLGAHILAAVAARVPFLKLHIPYISTLGISVISSSTRVEYLEIRRDNFLTIFLIKFYQYDNIFTII